MYFMFLKCAFIILKQIFILLMLLDIISYFYYCYFINSWNKTDVYYIEINSTSMIPVFVTVLLVVTDHKHQYSTVQHFSRFVSVHSVLIQSE
jgi:hypothetical protein